MHLRNTKGFTLIEVIVVAGIIAILAGILVPLIFKEIDESKISRAAADIRSISTSLIVLRKDTGQWPVSASCSPEVVLLVGAGTVPALNAGVSGWNVSEQGPMDNYLQVDANSCWPNTWKGPYMASVNMDPWGHAYMVNSDQFSSNPKKPVWILSAGPNGLVDTPADNAIVIPDDVGMRLQ